MITKSQAKYIQSLGQKKFRDQEGVFIAEGPKTIYELLASSQIELVNLFAIQEWAHDNPDAMHRVPNSKLIEIDRPLLDKISHLTTPNQVMGIFRKPSWQTPHLENRISLMLEDVQDPGNLGTIVRLADWFDIRLVICSPHCADAFGPKAIQSSMGSIGRIQIIYTELKKFLLDYQNLPIYATTLTGQSIFEIHGPQEAIILLGNESRGISSELLDLSTKKITIPRRGAAESLNAAIAAGIILSHLTR